MKRLLASISMALLGSTLLFAACSSSTPNPATGKGGSGGSAAGSTGQAGTTGGAGTTGAAGTGAAGTGAAGTGAAGTGAAGTGAAGTGAAGTGAAGTGAAGTGAAGATGKMAVAMITMLTGGTVMGTATFTAAATGMDVTVQVDLTNCPTGNHPMHIHQGTGCATMGEQGMHWAPPRGENIGPNGGESTCDAQMKGTLTYTRVGTAANLRWTIGDGSATDIIGHPLIVHGATDPAQRHGCGVILAKP